MPNKKSESSYSQYRETMILKKGSRYLIKVVSKEAHLDNHYGKNYAV